MASGQSYGHNVQISCGISLLLTTFLGIALYNVIELTAPIFTTFKKIRGHYFCSLLVASWGIVPYVIGVYLKYFTLTSSDGRARWVLYMIIINGILCHVSGFVLIYGTISPNPKPYLRHFPIYEKLQVTVFFVQEVIISSLYVYKTSNLLRILSGIQARGTRLVMRHLILANVIIILLDISLLALEYAEHYDVEVSLKATVYSVKLKMEFSVLNGLVDLFHSGSREPSLSAQPGRTIQKTIPVLQTHL
ncbi:hypothetical protein K458DRAFT_478336 [Lentithecium fluviatile CBS 122367]|uniref:DUF7703 domain-containing protein n=1 Tax=Lentithecium fluviatile CBS 122367 TaxID=1168545 RepID=A0A6G1IYV3_9PLEO|nr:hypothetical protein K458DRAFT_478336 [Lentithecium fluviatile CBS 122367]